MSRLIDADALKADTELATHPVCDCFLDLIDEAETADVYAELKEQIKTLKAEQSSPNQDYYTGYMSALSTVEGIIAQLEEGDL